MKKTFTLKKQPDGIGILYFDLPGEKINKFSTSVMMELSDISDELMNEDLKCLLLMSKKENIFIAGADIGEIKGLNNFEDGYQAALRGQSTFAKFTKMPFPTISVIDGACMGGGTEVSLACTFRIASDRPSTKIALPEVTLGILPGWGGTVRLPKLIGIQRALDFILTGKGLNAKRALRSGIIDKIIPAEWVEQKALEFAHEVINQKTDKYIEARKPKGLLNLALEKTPFGRSTIFSQAKKMVLKKTGGHYPAPLRAIKVIKETFGLPLETAFDIEARALGELISSPICKNLVQIYLWTEEIKKENGIPGSRVKAGEIKKSAVLGAGVMGGGIAQLFAAKDIDVRVKDINHDAVAKAFQQAASVLKEQVKRRRISIEKSREIMLRISGTTDYSGFKNTDLVVEAIVENLDIKKSVLAELEKEVPKTTIIASNTSSLLINDMAIALKKSDRFVGMHFFNPVDKMPLVEIIRGEKTNHKTVATIFQLSKKAGKTPIVVNDGPGFLVNRLLLPYMVEAISLLEEGHAIQAIDGAMKHFGMPMGPIELFDEVGIDVAQKVAKILKQTMSDRMAESTLLEKLVSENRLGKKNGLGFYKYKERQKIYDASIESFISVGTKTELDETQLSQRMVYPMINEAARCLKEGIVSSARDCDIGMIFGTGFAPFRGGLLKFADSEGLDKVVNTLSSMQEKFGDRFKPSKALLNFQKTGFFYKENA